jgi:hypothetical protein
VVVVLRANQEKGSARAAGGSAGTWATIDVAAVRIRVASVSVLDREAEKIG